jgi:hypothetical protein
MWLDPGIVTNGMNGSYIWYAILLNMTYSHYIVVNPDNGTTAVQLNSCDPQNIGPKEKKV